MGSHHKLDLFNDALNTFILTVISYILCRNKFALTRIDLRMTGPTNVPRTCGMCYPLCGMVHITQPLLLIGETGPDGAVVMP